MVQYNVLPTGLNTPPDVWDENGKVLSFGNPRYQELYESSRPIESFNNGKPEELGLTREEQMKEPSRKRSEEVNTVYDVVDVMPQFPGGEQAQMSFLARTIVYPQRARENGEQGTIYVKYIVEKDGSISEASPVDGNFSSLILAMEAVRVVRLFPTHSPGMLNGIPVRTKMVIPVKFVLQ
jgi:protein TonB